MGRDFNGSNNNGFYTTSANSPQVWGTAITVSVWFISDATGGTQRIIMRDNQTDSARVYGINWGSSDQIEWDWFNTGGNYRGFGGDTTGLNAGQLYHVLCHCGGAPDSTIYIDGVSDGTGSNQQPEASEAPGIAIGCRVQADGSPTTTGDVFDGMICEAAQWNRILTAEQIAALAAGVSPAMFPKDLIYHVPLLGGTGDVGGTLGTTFTERGTVGDRDEHAPIIQPYSPTIVAIGTGGAPPTGAHAGPLVGGVRLKSKLGGLVA